MRKTKNLLGASLESSLSAQDLTVSSVERFSRRIGQKRLDNKKGWRFRRNKVEQEQEVDDHIPIIKKDVDQKS